MNITITLTQKEREAVRALLSISLSAGEEAIPHDDIAPCERAKKKIDDAVRALDGRANLKRIRELTKGARR